MTTQACTTGIPNATAVDAWGVGEEQIAGSGQGPQFHLTESPPSAVRNSILGWRVTNLSWAFLVSSCTEQSRNTSSGQHRWKCKLCCGSCTGQMHDSQLHMNLRSCPYIIITIIIIEFLQGFFQIF